MKDRIPKYPGRVKLVPVPGKANEYTMSRADEPEQEGTPLNKATLLKDTTASRLGLDPAADPTVNDALACIPVYKHVLRTQIFVEDGYFSVPEDAVGNEFTVRLFGGGGGGTGSTYSGGGGGGGHMAVGTFVLEAKRVIPVTIGAGGAYNNAGGASAFGGYLSAAGGSGGEGYAGGDGGSGGGSAGLLKYSYAPGSFAGGSASYGGGGGGSGGHAAARYNVNGNSGGNGGTHGGGGGGGGSVYDETTQTQGADGTGGAGGTYGGNGGAGSPGNAGTDTRSLDLDFVGSGAGGPAGEHQRSGTTTLAAGGGGGGGGYGGSGGAGGDGVHGTAAPTNAAGGGGGGGGYGAPGGAGAAGGNSGDSANIYGGGGGGGGGYGGAGQNAVGRYGGGGGGYGPDNFGAGGTYGVNLGDGEGSGRRGICIITYLTLALATDSQPDFALFDVDSSGHLLYTMDGQNADFALRNGHLILEAER